jgi:protein phosphatase PTC7
MLGFAASSRSGAAFCRFLKLISAGQMIPHPAKAATGGEDAFFVGDDHKTVGVADGVGGWAGTPGANPAKYSRDLMAFSKELCKTGNPLHILEEASKKLDFSIPGSTTAMVAQVQGDTLHTCNVGDSACCLIHNGKGKFVTRLSLHGFNFPQQIGHKGRTKPSDGAIDKAKLEKGDLIISGTDGLWDNVWMNTIENVVKQIIEDSRNCLRMVMVANIADFLAKSSHVNGMRKDFHSPFAEEARKAGFQFMGGKIDDVTVVASLVVDDADLFETD